MYHPEPDAPEGESAPGKPADVRQREAYSFKSLLERFYQAQNFPAVDEDLDVSLSRRAGEERKK